MHKLYEKSYLVNVNVNTLKSIDWCNFRPDRTHVNVVEDGDIEGEPLPPLDRVGESQLCKEVLADEQGGGLSHSKANLEEENTDNCSRSCPPTSLLTQTASAFQVVMVSGAVSCLESFKPK